MNKIPNKKQFSYNMEKLLGVESSQTQEPFGEISLVISNMPSYGSWRGLHNGVHALNGSEGISSTKHSWKFGDRYSGIKLYGYLPATTKTKQYVSVCYYTADPDSTHSYNERYSDKYSTKTYYASTTDIASVPSIAYAGRKVFDWSVRLNGVTFTFSKGYDWSRGNM